MMATLDSAGRQEKFREWLEAKLSHRSRLSIGPLEKAPAGTVNENYFFDLRWQEDGVEKTEHLVVRWPCEQVLLPENDLPMQVRVMKCLENTGLPVPKVFWSEDDESVLGTPFYVMEKMEGVSPPDTGTGLHGHGLFYDATPQQRTQLWWRGVEAMAKVHTLDWEGLGLSFLGGSKGGTDPLDNLIDYWGRTLNWVAPSEPLPVLRAGFDWLRKNKFEPKQVSLCWGDSRLTNNLFCGDQVCAILDWDLAHIGPPEDDLFWFISIDFLTAESRGVPRLEGMPGTEETVEYYERLTGRPVENLLYHQVFGALRCGVVMVMGAKVLAQMRGMPGIIAELAENNWGTRKVAELLKL